MPSKPPPRQLKPSSTESPTRFSRHRRKRPSEPAPRRGLRSSCQGDRENGQAEGPVPRLGAAIGRTNGANPGNASGISKPTGARSAGAAGGRTESAPRPAAAGRTRSEGEGRGRTRCGLRD